MYFSSVLFSIALFVLLTYVWIMWGTSKQALSLREVFQILAGTKTQDGRVTICSW